MEITLLHLDGTREQMHIPEPRSHILLTIPDDSPIGLEWDAGPIRRRDLREFIRDFPGAVTDGLRRWVAIKAVFAMKYAARQIVTTINGVECTRTPGEQDRLEAEAAEWMALAADMGIAVKQAA